MACTRLSARRVTLPSSAPTRGKLVQQDSPRVMRPPRLAVVRRQRRTARVFDGAVSAAAAHARIGEERTHLRASLQRFLDLACSWQHRACLDVELERLGRHMQCDGSVVKRRLAVTAATGTAQWADNAPSQLQGLRMVALRGSLLGLGCKQVGLCRRVDATTHVRLEAGVAGGVRTRAGAPHKLISIATDLGEADYAGANSDRVFDVRLRRRSGR